MMLAYIYILSTWLQIPDTQCEDSAGHAASFRVYAPAAQHQSVRDLTGHRIDMLRAAKEISVLPLLWVHLAATALLQHPQPLTMLEFPGVAIWLSCMHTSH